MSLSNTSGYTRNDWLVLSAITLLAVAAFANGLTGEFVLDDGKQIVRNDLIRTPRFWGEALTRDIWAFRGERDTAWSNYWRPGHVAWLIVNYQLFGADRATPWHVTNLLAHLGVVWAGYLFVRKLGASIGAATAIIGLFAVHPTRCESVTWIAGVHDVLAALWQLLAMLCLMSIWRRTDEKESAGIALWIGAILLYAFAICTKEIAIFFPLIAGVVRFTDPAISRLDARQRVRSIVASLVPFIAIAIVFLIARRLVLGQAQLRFAWQPGWMTVLATTPLILATYLRLIVFPHPIGWSYPLRAVTAQNVGLWNFWLPLLVVVVAVVLARRFLRGRLAAIGIAIFVLTLAPALNIKAFLPEQLVKDRYLYMPLLGFLIAIVPACAEALRRMLGQRNAVAVGASAVTLLVAAMSVQTIRYNVAWRTELSIWQWAVRADPSSSINHATLGHALLEKGRADDALAEFNDSLAIEPSSAAHIGRGQVLTKFGKYDEAIEEFRKTIRIQPERYIAYELLAITLEKSGRRDDAIEALQLGRTNVPYRGAIFSDQIAVLHYQAGRRDEALAELEGARAKAESDFAPSSRLVLFHLGMLYGEMGRREDAFTTLRRFLELTEGAADPNIVPARKTARAALGSSPP